MLSRRNFLKLSGLGLSSLFLLPFRWNHSVFDGLQGRVLERNISIYDIPSFSGKKLKVYWTDNVIPITGVTIGDNSPEHNRVWYKIGDEGFAHSGGFQPVKTVTNPVANRIPDGGALAEVTVPFTDVHWEPSKESVLAYRYYYGTTHWVIDLVYDSLGKPWYGILEDKWEFLFYAQAAHLRFIPTFELSALSPHVPPSDKRLEIRTAEQVLVAYEKEKPVFMTRVSTGAQFRDGNYTTPPGRYITFHKRPSRHMAAGNLAANGYDLPGVPWVTYFTEEGISIHGTFWHNDFGRQRSHGCINLTPEAAKWVYLWTSPFVPPDQQKVYEDFGTTVDVF